jgi:imidazolonepropionase-like amidohydrolase
MRCVLTADKVITDDGADADAVVVNDQRIESVGKYADLRESLKDVTRIDFAGLCLAPGFIDTHVHITGDGTINSPNTIQAASSELLLLRAAANGHTALTEGVTTARDVGARNDVILAYRNIANSGVITAPRMLCAGAPLTRTGGHGYWWGLEADTKDQIKTAVRSQSKAGTDTLKVMVDGGIDLGRSIPGLLYFNGEDLKGAVDEAHDWGLRVAAHCLTAPGIRSATTAGVDSIEHAIFYDLKLDDTKYDPDLGAEILEKGIYVDPGPAFAYAVFSTPAGASSMFAKNARLFHRRLEDDALMFEQKIPLVAGSDAGWFGTPFGQYALIPQLFVDKSGIAAKDAFDICTKLSARSLGMEKDIGTIAVGKLADVVALEGDPRVDITAMARVKMTMLAGKVVYDGRNVVPATPAVAEAISAAPHGVC